MSLLDGANVVCTQEEVAEVRQAAAVAGGAAMGQEVRDLCASRLLSLLGSAAASAKQGAAAQGEVAARQHSGGAGAVAEVAQLVAAVRGGKAAAPAREGAPPHAAVLHTLQAIQLEPPAGAEASPLCSQSVPPQSLRHIVQGILFSDRKRV